MNKKLFLAVVLLIVMNTTFAQGFQFGVKGGADITQISGLKYTEKFAFGYHLGAFAIVSLGSAIAIQPELYYSAVNADTATGFANVYQVQNVTRFSYRYLNIPILLNINASKHLAFQLGPKFGVMSNSNLSLVSNGNNAIKNGDIAAVGGVQISFLRLKVYGRYQIGLSDINNISEATNSEKWTNQSIHIGAALRIL
jgi:hypothetical protein